MKCVAHGISRDAECTFDHMVGLVHFWTWHEPTRVYVCGNAAVKPARALANCIVTCNRVKMAVAVCTDAIAWAWEHRSD